MKSLEGLFGVNVFFGIKMHQAAMPPLISMKKHLEQGSSIKSRHTGAVEILGCMLICGCVCV